MSTDKSAYLEKFIHPAFRRASERLAEHLSARARGDEAAALVAWVDFQQELNLVVDEEVRRIQEAKQAGRTIGYDEGYRKGFDAGVASRDDDDYEAGQTIGYDEGYEAARGDVLEGAEQSLRDLLFDVRKGHDDYTLGLRHGVLRSIEQIKNHKSKDKE